jgi:hypothetical protein
MKNKFFILLAKIKRHRVISIFLTIYAFLIIGEKIALSQENEESPDKLSLSMNLSTRLTNNIRSIKIEVSRKENEKFVSVDNLKSPFNLYLNEVKKYDPIEGTGWLGNLILNKKGEGVFRLTSNFNDLTANMHEYTFIVKMDSDPIYEDVEDQITVSVAKLKLDYLGDDSIKTATATLLAYNEDELIPVTDIEVKLYIKRTFNFLPFGEEGLSTDENGEVSAELPLDIPGNQNGTITIAAKLEDDDSYGTIEVIKVVPWSVLPFVNAKRERTLWSSGDNAPLPLVIASVTIIAFIWGTIFYLVYLLFKIKKLSRIP